MKTTKILFVLLALFFTYPVMQAQKSVYQLFSQFSKEKGVERVNLGSLTFKFAGLFHDTMGVTGIEVLSFDACEQSVKDKLIKEIASLKDKDYETMVSVNEDKQRAKILVKLKDDMIKEIIVLASGDDIALIRIKGNINPSDIDKVIKENKSSK